jgi:hypothetical protein
MLLSNVSATFINSKSVFSETRVLRHREFIFSAYHAKADQAVHQATPEGQAHPELISHIAVISGRQLKPLPIHINEDWDWHNVENSIKSSLEDGITLLHVKYTIRYKSKGSDDDDEESSDGPRSSQRDKGTPAPGVKRRRVSIHISSKYLMNIDYYDNQGRPGCREGSSPSSMR